MTEVSSGTNELFRESGHQTTNPVSTVEHVEGRKKKKEEKKRKKEKEERKKRKEERKKEKEEKKRKKKEKKEKEGDSGDASVVEGEDGANDRSKEKSPATNEKAANGDAGGSGCETSKAKTSTKSGHQAPNPVSTVKHVEGHKKKKKDKEEEKEKEKEKKKKKKKEKEKKKENGGDFGDAPVIDGDDGANDRSKEKPLANDVAANSDAGETSKAKTSKKSKRVHFNDSVEVLAPPKKKKKKSSDDGLLHGKRFTKEEDEILRKAVLKYIEDRQLGEEGVNMVMKCKKHKEIRDCWVEIGEALPSRHRGAIYSRAHILFERSECRKWTKEELEEVRLYHEKHGPKWRQLADEIGRSRVHVKDAYRQVKLANKKDGHWSQDEYQNLFDLVNKDLRIRAFMDRKSQHGMLRDNIGWEKISGELTTRTDPICCMKWYNQLSSKLVASGLWVDTDDYRLLMALVDIDATCQEDVDWDNVLEHRSGNVCRKRWNEMVRHIGKHGVKSFSEQVDILSQRYCHDVLEARETYDNKPFVD